MSEDNKALVRRWFAEVDKGNPTIEDELLPPDYIDHDPPLPGMAPGREGVKQANALLRAAFPDTVHTCKFQKYLSTFRIICPSDDDQITSITQTFYVMHSQCCRVRSASL
jgi:hypothetical protein